MIDTTICPNINGQGFGRDLKYALSLLLLTKGFHSISGRNRDQMASSMIAINSSLGAYETEYIREDYPDFEEFRDVVYYTYKLAWQHEEINLTSKTTSPLCGFIPTSNFIKKNIPIMNNKICLSNFVSKDFLNLLDQISKNMPDKLKHIYTTSGQSECVDKIVKSLWFNRNKNQQNSTLLTFKGHYFGKGSFLARDLSGLHDDNYFSVLRLENPTLKNYKKILNKIKENLINKEILSIWLEPLLQKTMQQVPTIFLEELLKLSKEYDIPVVFNETASSSYGFSQKSEFVSAIEKLTPSASMIYLGGQGGICYLDSKYFIEAPLMVISTWDGDELSFSQYHFAQNYIKSINYNKVISDFEQKLTKLLEKFSINIQLTNARGSFSGNIPLWLRTYFTFNNGLFIVNPSIFAMEKFCKEYTSLIKKLKEIK